MGKPIVSHGDDSLRYSYGKLNGKVPPYGSGGLGRGFRLSYVRIAGTSALTTCFPCSSTPLSNVRFTTSPGWQAARAAEPLRTRAVCCLFERYRRWTFLLKRVGVASSSLAGTPPVRAIPHKNGVRTVELRQVRAPARCRSAAVPHKATTFPASLSVGDSSLFFCRMGMGKLGNSSASSAMSWPVNASVSRDLLIGPQPFRPPRPWRECR